VNSDVLQFHDQVESEVLSITSASMFDTATPTIADGSRKFIERLAARLDSNSHGVTGIPTGFAKLDKYTTGIHPLYYIIAARPSVGKTMLMMNIAEHFAIAQKKPVAIFSLEMSIEELTERLYSSVTRINSMSIRTGNLNNAECNRILNAINEIDASGMIIDDTTGLDIAELRRRARRFVHKHGAAAIFVDYLGLIESSSRRALDNDTVRVSIVSAGLKNLQRELKVPVIACCQLNRDKEKRGDDARPKLSDLRQSGSIEQDADVVLLLHRKLHDEDPTEACKTVLDIAKQRHGPIGLIPLTLLNTCYRFESSTNAT
jgi:replicative DNA helicase